MYSVSKVTEDDGIEAEIDFYLVGVFCDDSHGLEHGLLVLERSQAGGATWSCQIDTALRSGPRAALVCVCERAYLHTRMTLGCDIDMTAPVFRRVCGGSCSGSHSSSGFQTWRDVLKPLES